MVCKYCYKELVTNKTFRGVYLHKGAVGALVRYCYPVTATTTAKQITMTATPICTKDYLKALKKHVSWI